MSKVGQNLERFKIAANAHDRENDGKAYGVALAYFDMERLGFEEGEELWPGFTIHADDKGTGNFRILCDCPADHDKELTAEAAKEDVRAVGVEA